VQSAATQNYATLTGVVVGVVVIAALYFGKEVLLPVTVAILLSFVLSPLVRLLRRINIPRPVAVLFSVALALGTIAGIGTLVATQVVDLAGDLPRYQLTIEKKVDALHSATIGRMSQLTTRFRNAVGQTQQGQDSVTQPPKGEDSAANRTPMPVEVHQPSPDALELARRILIPVLYPLTMAGIIFVVTVFILMQQDDLRDRLIRLFGSHDLHRTTLAMDDAARRLSRFFLVQLGINAAVGLIIATVLYLLGLPSALLWGAIAGLMRFVPYIGSYIAAVGPILLAAAVDSGWLLSVAVAGLFLVTEPLAGQVAEPMLYGRSTGLSPISVVISVIFWTWLWGPVGLILATPLTLCLVVLGQHVKQLEFLNVLFGNRPALTGAESFYQRVLAGDLDELQENAEDLLKKMSLSSYYDEIALKGLELAAHDIARGVLTMAQLERIHDIIAELVDALSDYDDVEPTEKDDQHHEAEDDQGNEAEKVIPLKPARRQATAMNSGETVVEEEPPPGSTQRLVCVASRGLLEEAVGLMLVQILGKHRLKAEVMKHQAVSRSQIGQLRCADAAVICICYIDAGDSTSQLRYLIRRLRQRVPTARLLVAIWPSDHPVRVQKERQESLAADYYVSSVRAAVDVCLEASAALEKRASAVSS
jgi:predicted PurR-regulated permease PerM